MKNYSLTFTGIVVMVAGTFLVDFGFTEQCAGEISDKIPLIIGAVVALYGRVRAGGVTPFGTRV